MRQILVTVSAKISLSSGLPRVWINGWRNKGCRIEAFPTRARLKENSPCAPYDVQCGLSPSPCPVGKASIRQPLFLHPLIQTRGSPLDREILAETGYEDLAHGSGTLPSTATSRLANM